MTDVAPGYEASIIWLKFEFSGKMQHFGKYLVAKEFVSFILFALVDTFQFGITFLDTYGYVAFDDWDGTYV